MMHLDVRGATVGIEPLTWPKVDWPPILKGIVPFKEWHHVVGVFDSKIRHVYIDGALNSSAPHVEGTVKTLADVAIGYDSRACCNQRKMTAVFDEVRLWNRALSAKEIKDIFTIGPAGFGQSVEPQNKLTTTWSAMKR